jgi:DEAD/DEAH box helicase domain-containing protein
MLLACYTLRLCIHIQDQVVHAETVAGHSGRYGELNFELAPEISAALQHIRGGQAFRFFAHQAEGINAVASGQHLAISTATSSGKSVVFTVPVLQTVLTAEPNAVALFVFPTKALAQDQVSCYCYALPCTSKFFVFWFLHLPLVVDMLQS